MHLNQTGEVVFKAELGAVTPEATQVQGVWMNPEFRGLGLSAGYMAAVVVLAQTAGPGHEPLRQRLQHPGPRHL